MTSTWSLLSLVHLIGLALGVGGATAKLVLLARCRTDTGFVPTFAAVARPVTRVIITGLVLLILSGIGFLLAGYGFTPVLIVKLVLVGAVLVLGPLIDHVFEPRFLALAPASDAPPSDAFKRARGGYLLVEILATGLFYVIVVMWVLT